MDMGRLGDWEVGGRSAAGASSTSPNPTTTAFLPDGEKLLLRLPPTYFPLPPLLSVSRSLVVPRYV